MCLVCLLAYGVRPFAVGIAKGIGSDAAAEVDIFFAVGVAALCAAAAFQRQIKPSVAPDDGAVVFFNDFFRW